MQQHPIPQNVTAYEFHIIGNMTIKQFLELGAGIGIGVFFYATNLADFIKWPLILLSAAGGGAIAFLPFDGRPLDRMIIVFFKSVYSPTQYIWRKQVKIPDFFNFKPRPQNIDNVNLERQKLRKNLAEYLNTLPSAQVTEDPNDTRERTFVTNINSLFDSTPAATNVTPSQSTIAYHPSIKPQIRKLKPQTQINLPPPQPKSTSLTISIPQSSPVAVVKPTPTQTTSSDNEQSHSPKGNLAQPSADVLYQATPVTNSVQATQNQNLPFPDLPKTPNTLVGMVLDHQGKIVENAIVEVRDQTNLPVRALKSNRLGQFFSATPLSNGKYQIVTDKTGVIFTPVTIELTGQIIKPLEIRAN